MITIAAITSFARHRPRVRGSRFPRRIATGGAGSREKEYPDRGILLPCLSCSGAAQHIRKMNKNRISTRGLRTLTAMALVASLFTSGAAFAADSLAWDKTFPQSDKVIHQKVSFNNRLGINLVADLYLPKNLDRSKKHPAIVVGGPYGAVKEQSAGLYAQTMAERGFVTIAHDPSYNGESGGQPHFTASFEALIEDFSAAVDFLGTKPFVDRERIGVIGVCGSGSFGLAAAETDSRIKAVATVSMYDIGQAHRQGLAEKADTAAIKKSAEAVSKQRWAEVDGAERTMAIGTPQKLTEKSSDDR